jgi:hypothetical protein
MKLFRRGVVLVAAFCLLNGCSSKNEVMTESSASRAPVAGENVSGGSGGVTPGAGPGGASANVRW